MMTNQKYKKNIQVRRQFVWVFLSAVISLGLVSCGQSYSSQRVVFYYDMNQPVPIMSRGRAQVEPLLAFFLETNPAGDRDEVVRIAQMYLEEAAIEGVNHDVAFCQMCVETNYLRFTGAVSRRQNNFCGLGATGGSAPGDSFGTMQTGVRAHIQHLKAYASHDRLRRRCVDPRFDLVRRGSAPCVQDLTKKWATDPEYGYKIKKKLQSMERYL